MPVTGQIDQAGLGGLWALALKKRICHIDIELYRDNALVGRITYEVS